MSETLEAPLIFLSYAREDQDEVVYFYERLKSAGLDVWMDVYSLKGGQRWEVEAIKALKKADIIIFFLSNTSATKRGNVRKEFRIALDHALKRLDEDIYIIPVMIEKGVPVPDELSHLHVISGDRDELIKLILESVFSQLQRTGGSLSIAREPQPISWSLQRHVEEWEGLPGYEIECDVIDIKSDKFKNVSEITGIINGALFKGIHESRRAKFRQNADFHSFGQEKFLRTDTWEANCQDVVITGSTLSIHYNIYWYGAGAAHPNSHFMTFCFSLDPLIYFENLSEIFRYPETALGFLQDLIREQILSNVNGNGFEFEKEWVIDGTQDWDALSSFLFARDGLILLFPPYQIAPYAAGSHSVLVPYAMIADKLDKNVLHLLGISHL